MSLALVIGVGVVVMVFMLFSFLVDKERHAHIRNFLLIISFPLLFLIPASLVLEQTNCEKMINQTITTGNITTYTYGEVCITNHNGSMGLLKAMGVILFIFIAYVFIRYFGDIIKVLTDVVRGR